MNHLLDRNVAGKTTIINLFPGCTNATSGEHKINDVVVKPNDVATQKFVIYIPEMARRYSKLDGIKNLDFFSRLTGFKYIKEMLTDFFTKAGLQREAHQKRLRAYSKGLRRKAGIAIALAKNAAMILMDESTSGLDPKAKAEYTAIRNRLAAISKTIFMATNDIFNTVSVSHRIVIMKEGSLVHSVSTSNISAVELQNLYLETIDEQNKNLLSVCLLKSHAGMFSGTSRLFFF